MIAIVFMLLGVLIGLLGSSLVRRRPTVTGSRPMLAELRETLDGMERDYRIRVATAELERTGPPVQRYSGGAAGGRV